MATTTPNFGWTVPTSTDLVKDGATAIETLGDGIDASFVDLKGGTTGQVLSKASGTDLDFTWVAQDDSNAIQNAIVDAKGDLIAATAADTPARLAVGTDGQILTADSTAATGIKWATPASTSALVYVGGTTFSASSSVSVNNVFSSSYANYLVIGDYVGTAAAGVSLRLRVSGADNTTANYNSQSIYGAGSTAGAARALSATSMNFIDVSTDPSFCHINVINPFATAKTGIGGYGIYALTEAQNKMCTFNATTSFTGFTIFPSTGTMTGTLRVYGLANS